MNQIIPNEMQQAFLECENLAKGIRNFDLASQSNQVFPLVNALAFRLTQVIGCTEYIAINGRTTDMYELRNGLRWLGVLIKAIEGQSFYYINRGKSDIILGRTSSLIRDYSLMTSLLLESWDSIFDLNKKLDEAMMQSE